MLTLRKIPMVIATLSLLFVIGCASGPDSASLGETIDDTVITTRVKAAIIEDDELSAAEINVETFKGVVQLSGFVSDTSDIARAAAVTRNIKGVVSVKNDIVRK